MVPLNSIGTEANKKLPLLHVALMKKEILTYREAYFFKAATKILQIFDVITHQYKQASIVEDVRLIFLKIVFGQHG